MNNICPQNTLSLYDYPNLYQKSSQILLMVILGISISSSCQYTFRTIYLFSLYRTIILSSYLVNERGNNSKDYIISDQQQLMEQQPSPSVNWKEVLFTPQITTKIQLFKNWQKDQQQLLSDLSQFKHKEYLSIIYPSLLHKDLIRTRSQQSFMHNFLFIQSLQSVVVYYCNTNFVNYQQGLLEIAIPFVLLKAEKKMKLKVCYGLFDSFMNCFFPPMLTQKYIHGKKQLPITAISLHLLSTLLNYFYPQVFYHLESHSVPLSMIFTAQLMTLFAKNMKISFVYQVWVYFIEKCKKLNKKEGNSVRFCSQLIVLLAMCLGLIGLSENKILEKQEEDIFQFVQKSLKSFDNIEELKIWFELSSQIIAKIPLQFYEHVNKSFGITTKAINDIRNQEIYEQMLLKNESSIFDSLIEIKSLIEFNSDKQNILLIVTADNKLFKEIRRYDRRFLLLELSEFMKDKGKRLQNQVLIEVQNKINQIANKRPKLSTAIVVIPSVIKTQESQILSLKEKLIKILQVNFKIKCFKIEYEVLTRENEKLLRELNNTKSNKCQII